MIHKHGTKMEEVKETFETIEEQYSKLKFILENDRDDLFNTNDSNEAQIFFRVIINKLKFVIDFTNLDADCILKLKAIMLHISTEEAKFLSRCGNELKGANILLDAIRDSEIRSTEFPLICLRAANVCAALLIQHDCNGSVESAASVVRKAVEDYKEAEERGLAMCKLSGERLLHLVTGHALGEGDVELECREAVSTALLLLAVGHGRVACQVLHTPFLQHALSVQLVWPSAHLDRRRWTAAALSLAACFIDGRRLRTARRYLCAAGCMLQREINSKDNALPDVKWFESIQTLLRHLFELIVGYSLAVFRTSRPHWNASPQKSPEHTARSRDLAGESSVAEDSDSDLTDAPGSAQFADQEDDEDSLDLGAKLGKLVQEADRRLVDKLRETITPTHSALADSFPGMCFISVSKAAADIDDFAMTGDNMCSDSKAKMSNAQKDPCDNVPTFRETSHHMVATNEPVDIEEFAISVREVSEEMSDLSGIDETVISTPPDPLEGEADSIGQKEKENIPAKGGPATTGEENAEDEERLSAMNRKMSHEELKVDAGLEVLSSGSRISSDSKDGIDVNGDATKPKEEVENSTIGLDRRLAESDTLKKEQREETAAEFQQSLLRSGAGDSECSVQVWSAAVVLAREEVTSSVVADLEQASPEAPHPVTLETNAGVESGLLDCKETELHHSEPSMVVTEINENEDADVLEVDSTEHDCRQEAYEERVSAECSQQLGDEDDDDQWEDLSSSESESEDEEAGRSPSTPGAEGSSEDGLDQLDMSEWEAAIPPPPVRTPSDAAALLEAGCCWLERYKTAVEGRFNKQLLLNMAELMRLAARFLPYGRIRKRLLRAAIRRLHAARGLCDGSGDATERRVLCGLSLSLVELRLAGGCVGGASQLRAAAEALSALSAALHQHGRSQLLLQHSLHADVLAAPFGS